MGSQVTPLTFKAQKLTVMGSFLTPGLECPNGDRPDPSDLIRSAGRKALFWALPKCVVCRGAKGPVTHHPNWPAAACASSGDGANAGSGQRQARRTMSGVPHRQIDAIQRILAGAGSDFTTIRSRGGKDEYTPPP